MPFMPYNIKYSLCMPNIYTLFFCHYPKGFSATKELHDFRELVCIKKGSVRVTAGNRIYELASGDIVVYEPLEIHTFTVTDDGGADIFIFSFDAAGDILDRIAGKAFHMGTNTLEAADRIISCITGGKFRVDPGSIASVPCRMTKDAELREEIMPDIFMILLSLSRDARIDPVSNTASAVMFGELTSCMERNLNRNMHIDELSRLCGISMTSIQKIFGKYTGMSAHKYYMTLKLNTAIRYLSDGTDVTTCADRLGFSSQAHFSKVFKEAIGCSPTQYLKSVKG